jgi:aspartate/methionine/tyrosine aminotransferase
MTTRAVMGSTYMNWAKTSSQARYSLTLSGVSNLSIKDLDVSLDELELTDGGYGYAPLLQAIGERYRVTTESIVTAAGTTFANHLALAALIEPGDEILFEQPTYEPFLAVAQYLGANIKRFSRRFETGFGLSLEEIDASVSERTRLIVLANLHNPTGALIDDETLRAVGKIARQVGARVLIDEVYMETMFEPQPRTSFHLGEEFVVTSSLTKAFGLSGLRSGWVLAEPALAKKMWLLNDLFAATPVHVGERLSVVAFKQLDEIGAKVKVLLERNRKLMNDFLDTREDLEVVRPEFGTVMFPRGQWESSDEFCRLLKEKYETTVVPGRFFEMPGHFRIAFCGPTDVLEAGLQRIESALDELHR